MSLRLRCPSPRLAAAMVVAAAFLCAASTADAQGTLFVEGNRVGIGIDVPTQKLHLRGTTLDTGLLIHQTGTEAGAIPAMIDLVREGRVRFRLSDVSASGGNPWIFATRGDGFEINELLDGGQVDFVLSSGGTLTIAGQLRANGGGATFPDYVFDPAYELMPLPELAEYIRRERSLPNIPSAESIEAQGGTINMTELQLKLLEKVEELTLYVVQLGEETERLRAENAALREAIGER